MQQAPHATASDAPPAQATADASPAQQPPAASTNAATHKPKVTRVLTQAFSPQGSLVRVRATKNLQLIL